MPYPGRKRAALQVMTGLSVCKLRLYGPEFVLGASSIAPPSLAVSGTLLIPLTDGHEPERID